MLSQFTREAGHRSLSDLSFPFPKDVYPVGRLDLDSEGLLLLTNDTAVNQLLLNPERRHQRTYWVEVEGVPDDNAFLKLKTGVRVNLKGRVFMSLPASVKKITAPAIPERIPQVNYKKHPITSWLELTLTEGKNRQVRKMTAIVGHPTLRLIRYAMEGITLDGMSEGEVKELKMKEFYSMLRLGST